MKDKQKYSKPRDRVPVRYENSVKNSELLFIKVVHVSVSGREIKEEVPKHTGKEGPEALLQTIKMANTLIKRYNLHSTADSNTTGVALSFETMSRALANEPLNAWEKEYDSLRANQRNATGYKRCVKKVIEKVCGKEAFEKQLNYLENTRKPLNMSMMDWIEKIEEINSYLPVLDDSEESLSIEEVNKKIICKNLVGQDAVEYLRQGGKRLTDRDEIIELLESIEEARELNSYLKEKKRKKDENFKKKRNNNNTNHEESDDDDDNTNGCIKNKCRKHGNHSWFDCPDNPRNKSRNSNNSNRDRRREVNMNNKIDEEVNENNKNSNKTQKERTDRFLDRYDTEEESEEYYSMEKAEDMPKHKEDRIDIAHPETLVAVPCDPNGSKYKVVRGLMDFCATDSLIARELLDSDLMKYAEDGVVNEDNTTAWETGNGVFQSTGTVDIPRVHLPVFTKHNKFPMKFHVMPRKNKGEHSYPIIFGMKDLRRMKFGIDLEDNMMKWNGMCIPMVPRGYWSQRNIDAYCYNKVNSKRKCLADEVATDNTQEEAIDAEVKPKTEMEGEITMKVVVDTKESVLTVNNNEEAAQSECNAQSNPEEKNTKLKCEEISNDSEENKYLSKNDNDKKELVFSKNQKENVKEQNEQNTTQQEMDNVKDKACSRKHSASAVKKAATENTKDHKHPMNEYNNNNHMQDTVIEKHGNAEEVINNYDNAETVKTTKLCEDNIKPKNESIDNLEIDYSLF